MCVCIHVHVCACVCVLLIAALAAGPYLIASILQLREEAAFAKFSIHRPAAEQSWESAGIHAEFTFENWGTITSSSSDRDRRERMMCYVPAVHLHLCLKKHTAISRLVMLRRQEFIWMQVNQGKWSSETLCLSVQMLASFPHHQTAPPIYSPVLISPAAI